MNITTGDEIHPKTVVKPWGKEILIELNSKYAFKEILMNKGTRSSLQSHNKKLETIHVISGKIILEKISKNEISSFQKYGPNESYTILPGVKHRVKVLQDARLFEVSTPELNDVIRYKDDHGRIENLDIAKQHKDSKVEDYWQDLDIGNTTQYKKKVIEELITKFFPATCRSIIDIGCGGNCEHILKYKKKLNAQKIACLDYDKKIIEQMKKKYANEDIKWHRGDIFVLETWTEQYDLIFFLDMLHEIYSFYGRPKKDINKPVDHKLGQEFVKKAVTAVVNYMKPKGILITDAPICESNKLIKVMLKSEKVRKVIQYFLENYSTFEIEAKLTGNVLEIREQEFSTLLTQYNKIKKGNWDRWNVERLERHQYMTLSEYKEMFKKLGYVAHAVIETPPSNLKEWQDDFKILTNDVTFPEKRITLLAVNELKKSA